MAQVEKQLKASQKFLTGLKGLPNFPPLRQKQLQQVFSALDKSPNFGTEKASEIFDLLDEGIWDEEAIVAIKEKVANKSEEGLWKERRGMQNFARIVEFLPTSLWNGLQTSQSVERRVELLTRFMASLGLRCPSEPTLAVIMTVAGCLFGMNAGLTEEGKLDLLQVYKPRIRKWLNQERPLVEYMLELPPRWQDLPQEVQEKVYAADDFPKLPAGIDLSTIDFAVRSYPLRRSRSIAPPPVAASSSSADPLLAVGRLIAGVLQGPERSLSNVGAAVPAQSQTSQNQGHLALMDLPKDKEVSADVSKPFNLPAAAGGQMQEALVAASTEAETNLANKRVAAANAQTAEAGQTLTEHLDALRDGLRAESSADDKVAKRPAMKRPAAASESKSSSNPACVMKRPAQKKPVAKQTKKTSAADSKKADRARLLASIPQALKQRYRNCCATCRFRPYCCNSCWRKRGFS